MLTILLKQITLKENTYGFIFCLTEYVFFFKDFIYFIFKERGREGGSEGENHHCVVASREPPDLGPGPRPRHVP